MVSFEETIAVQKVLSFKINNQMQTSDIVRGEYTLSELIGEGAYGRVWRATKDDRRYAIKEEMCNREGVRSPIEMDILFRYDHPNLAKGIEFFFAPSTILNIRNPDNISTYLVMELADADLERYMSGDTERSEEERVRLCYELASALSVLHASGFYHCDIKPSNCLISNRSLKLGDFGLVRYKRVQGSICQSVQTAPPEVLGTRRRIYGLQEEDFPAGNDDLFNQPAIPITTELWAMGVTFAFILTGKFLFGVMSGEIVRNITIYRQNPSRFLTEKGVESQWLPLLLTVLSPMVATRTKSVDNVLQDELFTSRSYGKPIQGLVQWSYRANITCGRNIGVLVEWLFNVFDEYEVNQGTIFGTMAILYAVYNPIVGRGGTKEIQLLGVACLLLANKLYADGNIPTDELAYVTASTYSVKEIRRMERTIIEELQGILFFPTFYTLAFSAQALEKCLPVIRDCGKFLQTDPAIFVAQLEIAETPEERERRTPL